MTVDQTQFVMLLVLLMSFVLVCVGTVAFMAVLFWKVLKQNIWFHKAGRSMAEYELEKARLDLKSKEADAQKVSAEATKIRAETEHNTQRMKRAGQPLVA